MRGGDLFDEDRLGAGDVLDGLAWNGIGQKSDEVARMTGLEGDADFAVGLEAANAGAVAGARVDDNEWPQLRIDFDASGRNDAHKRIVHRPLERAAVDDQVRPCSRARAARFPPCARDTGCRAGACTSQNRTLRWNASIAYSMAGAKMPNGVMFDSVDGRFVCADDIVVFLLPNP